MRFGASGFGLGTARDGLETRLRTISKNGKKKRFRPRVGSEPLKCVVARHLRCQAPSLLIGNNRTHLLGNTHDNINILKDACVEESQIERTLQIIDIRIQRNRWRQDLIIGKIK